MFKFNFNNLRRAFTLQEVLIVIAIIGIVAVMSLINIIQSNREKQMVVRLKKAYTILQNAYYMTKEENGDPSTWFTNEAKGSKEAANTVAKMFIPYLKVSQVCYQEAGCFPNKMIKKTDNTNLTNYGVKTTSLSKVLTQDGMSIGFQGYGSAQNAGNGSYKYSYGYIIIDINGLQGPNKKGFDVFELMITSDGIFPLGDRKVSSLKANGDWTFPSGCSRKKCALYCQGCAAWVLQNENLDYLHCDDLSWNGKHSCR